MRLSPAAALLAGLVVVAGPARADGHGGLGGLGDLPFELPEGLDGLMDDVLRDLGPMLDDALGALEDLDAYEPPEILPNGDIIIRRRRPLPDGGILPPPKPGEINPDETPIWL